MTIELLVDPIVPLSAPHFGISFDDALGIRLFTVATYLSESCLPRLTKRSAVRCSIECLPLVPGKYVLSLNAGTVGGWLDELDQALGFEVQHGDFFGNGRPSNKTLGRMLVRSKWSTTAQPTVLAAGPEPIE